MNIMENEEENKINTEYMTSIQNTFNHHLHVYFIIT